jgi:hypothetical protein
METFVWVFVLAIAFLISFCAAKVAERKGRSFWAFLVLSFLFSPLIGLLIAVFGKDKTKEENLDRPM